MAVPNTTTFTLMDVRTEISNGGGGTATSLLDAFSRSNDSGFDINYKGSKNQLLNFRNYTHNTTTTYQKSLGVAGTSTDACTNHANMVYVTRWLDNPDFLSASKLWTNSAGTTNAGAGYYSDGGSWRYWNGLSFTSSGLCGGGFE